MTIEVGEKISLWRWAARPSHPGHRKDGGPKLQEPVSINVETAPARRFHRAHGSLWLPGNSMAGPFGKMAMKADEEPMGTLVSDDLRGAHNASWLKDHVAAARRRHPC
jgi:hypothetical protein